jgi:hypothetical protein
MTTSSSSARELTMASSLDDRIREERRLSAGVRVIPTSPRQSRGGETAAG